MNVKNFIVGGIVGGIIYFLLGWLIYGILLRDTFPHDPAVQENMLFIFLGSMSFGFLISYVFARGEGVSNYMSGFKFAAGIALFMGLTTHFFMNMMNQTIDVKLMAIDIIASMVIAAFVGAAVATINGKMK